MRVSFDVRDAESGGLARAGLGLAVQVAHVEKKGNDLRLDFGGLNVAHLADGSIDLIRKQELGEAIAGHFGRRRRHDWCRGCYDDARRQG